MLYLSFVHLKTNCMFLTGSTEGSKTLPKSQNYTTMTKTDVCCMLRRIETIYWITFKSTHCFGPNFKSGLQERGSIYFSVFILPVGFEIEIPQQRSAFKKVTEFVFWAFLL